MKIAVISDTHFGYGWGTEREDDPFRNAEEAFGLAQDADVVLLPGDVFDRKRPRQSVLARAIDILTGSWRKDSSLQARKGEETWNCGRKPVIAIHGTHERRRDDAVNPIQLLDRAGIVTHVHNEKIQLTGGDGETVAVHGMGGVPERYAPAVLERYDPGPVEEAFNVLMIHQSIEAFVYTDPDSEALAVEDFPPGFDYIVNGHIHWRKLDMKDDPDRPVILPGSTVTTQRNKIEAEVEKGMLVIDTEDGSIDVRTLSGARDVIVDDIDATGMTKDELVETVEDRYDLRGRERSPLLNLTLTGEPATDVTAGEIESALEDRAVPTVRRETVVAEASDEEESGRWDAGMAEDPRDIGDDLLEEAVSYEHIEDLVSLLVDDETDEALSLLRKNVPAFDADEGSTGDVDNQEGSDESVEDEEKVRGGDDSEDVENEEDGEKRDLSRFMD